MDETHVKVAGRLTYLDRAIYQHGQGIDLWLSLRRDLTAARAFFTRALVPGRKVTTDRAPKPANTEADEDVMTPVFARPDG